MDYRNKLCEKKRSDTNKSVLIADCADSLQLHLQGFAAERKGEREEMQDAHVIIDDYSTFVNSDNQ